ncbi:MAG TPA: LCP family protein, partial [Spirochaetota bacterium]|nr:LCP family protein [Spirochaetota bacterium]
MDTSNLASLLKRIILLILITFLLFVLFVNLYKIIDFVVNVDSIINDYSKENELSAIENKFISVNEQNLELSDDKAYTAKSLGFIDKLQYVNGSEWGEGINILIVGSDKRNFLELKSRADVIILLRIIKSGKILSLSIPRDTLIKIQDGGFTGEFDKIGHSLYWGGLNNLKNNVETLVGSPISKVVIVDNFRSF